MSDWPSRDRDAVWHPFTAITHDSENIAIERAEGVWLFAKDGKRYMDAISSWWVNLHGHAHPYIAKCVAEQAVRLEHVMFAGFTHQPAVELATRLLKHFPAQYSKVFYSDNGSTAVEVALKMAFQYWFNDDTPRKRVIALENGYHGDTLGAMAVGGRGVFSEPFEPFLFEVDFVPTPVLGMEDEALLRLETLLKMGDVAAFIFEPLVQGTAGMVVYSAEVLDKMMALCKQYGVLTIADEVMTGFGRTGTLFATDQCTTKPDLTCLSKGITGGFLPMGVTICTDAIYKAFWLRDDAKGRLRTFLHGHSYTANPMSCAAAVASLDLLEKDETWSNIRRIAMRHLTFAAEAKLLNGVADVRQKGVILAIEYHTTQHSGYFNSLRDALYAHFMERGIVLRPLGNIIYILPPYCITDAELELIYTAIRQFDHEKHR